MRAIVVDDFQSMRMILRTALVNAGFETIEAADGRKALDQLNETGPLDLALVDWNMPVMDGYQLLCAVRAQPKFASMPIMMVTSENSLSQVKLAIGAGANAYVVKPLTEAVLRQKLQSMGLKLRAL